MQTVGVKFGDLIPGQIFSWNSQYYIKIFETEGHNAAQLGIKWADGVYGKFMDDCLVTADPDQLPAKMRHTIVPTSVYEELVDDSSFLSSLEGMGVDNWEGYDMAREDYNEWKKEQQ